MKYYSTNEKTKRGRNVLFVFDNFFLPLLIFTVKTLHLVYNNTLEIEIQNTNGVNVHQNELLMKND